jgi:hypothetical protein
MFWMQMECGWRGRGTQTTHKHTYVIVSSVRAYLQNIYTHLFTIFDIHNWTTERKKWNKIKIKKREEMCISGGRRNKIKMLMHKA